MYEVENIRSVIQDGYRGFAYIEPNSKFYMLHYRNWFLKKYGMMLPEYDMLCRFGGPDSVRVLTEDISITIEFKDTSWMQFKFYKGFITDFASVPWFFRSVVDNDDNRLIIAALVHDFLFTTHGLPFRLTNDLFHQIALACGYSRIRARLAWLAVSSPIARRIWSNETIKRNEYTRKTAEMLLPRPVTINGNRYDSLLKANRK